MPLNPNDLPTDTEGRQALLALGRLTQAASYYAGLPNGDVQLSAQEKADLVNALQTLTRANITGFQVQNRSTPIPSTPFFTAPRSSMYFVTGYFVQSQAAAAGTATCTLTWNDGLLNQSENQFSGVPLTGTGQRSFVKAIMLAAGQTINVAVTLPGVSGTPIYHIFARVIEL